MKFDVGRCVTFVTKRHDNYDFKKKMTIQPSQNVDKGINTQ